MKPPPSSEIRALRAKAHHLHPVVIIGQHGLTPAVLHEIDVALLAHELIKIRVGSDARDERDRLLERICAEMDAAAVQHLGKVLTVWRPKPLPQPEIEPTAKKRRAARDAEPAAAKKRTKRQPATSAAPPLRRRRALREP